MKVRTTALTLAAAVAAAIAVVVVLRQPEAKESPYRLRPNDASVVAAGFKVNLTGDPEDPMVCCLRHRMMPAATPGIMTTKPC
jgi:hypothetical protein